jgi:ABC-type Mn2+/Zn2+ transport system permease subunit
MSVLPDWLVCMDEWLCPLVASIVVGTFLGIAGAVLIRRKASFTAMAHGLKSWILRR